ncbi:MAG TPA: hypothetical protein VGE21_05935 [Flavobacteriales bacterium]
MALLQLLALPVLGIIAWEDLRERSIRWWWLPVLLLLLAAPLWGQVSGTETGLSAAFNLCFLVLQCSAALALVMLRRGRWENPLRQWIGIGDLLFLLVVALALPTWSFLLYYLSGLLLCIPAHFALLRLRPEGDRSVPLAGLLAIHLGVWLLLSHAGVLPEWPTVLPFSAYAHG